MNIKVSVIVPVYNTEAYLEECIESLLKQTLKEIQILIVDDGSTDSSSDILSKYQDNNPEKIQVFTKVNGGQASARNYVLPFVKGKYIGFVDSDDWIDCDMYEQMYKKAEDENADIVICDMIDHYPNRTVYHHSSSFDNKFKITPSACNKLFRTDIIQNDRFPMGLWYEDFEFTTKQLMKTDCISVIHQGFYHCHCREVSTMNNDNSVKNKDILTVLEHLCKYVNENGWFVKYGEVLEYLYIDHVLITTINRVQIQKNKEKKKIIRILRKEVLKKYPEFYKDSVFREMPGNRRIVALLNAYGLSMISWLLIWIKGVKGHN